MQVESTEELTDALGASAEVNVGMGLFERVRPVQLR